MGTSRDLLEQEDSNDESAKEYLNHDWGNHDENAKVQRIAREEDLPEEAVRENLDELTRTRKKYDFSDHPKSAEFFADPDNASVVGDDVEHYKSLEQTLKDRKEPIFGERTAKLAWNAMTEARASITRALGTIAEGQREKIIRRYLGDDTYERAKAIDEKVKKEGAYVDPIEELSKTENRYAYNEGIDFSRKRTPETVKKAFSEEGAIAGIGEAGGFMYDTGVESMATQIPLMAIKTAGAPFYLLNLTEQIAKERAKNSGKEMTDEDMVWALPWAAGSYALDVLGFRGMIGAGKADKELLKEVAEGIAAKTVVKEGLKAGGREAGTEAFQEGFLEYMGERFGTEAKIELSEMLETGAWAGLAGGGMGAAIGTPSAYLNDRERRIKVLRDNERRRDINSVDGQLTIESVLDVVQQMPSVERSPEHVEKFMQAVGPDKQIIVTNEGLKAASTLGIQIPEGMRSPLGDAVLRISDFVNQVANKPDLMAAIRPHLKMRQEDMTQFEMDKQEGNPELAYLFGKADKASKLEKENRAAIEGVVKAMAGTRRMSEGTARKLTKFLSEYANRYVEDAAKKGVEITPKDAIDAMKLRFVGPKVDMDKEVNFEKAAARMLPREEFEAFKKLPKSEQLDRVARHYASLPVEQGGLGLSKTNTREDRENALGVKFKSGEDYVPQVAKRGNAGQNKNAVIHSVYDPILNAKDDAILVGEEGWIYRVVSIDEIRDIESFGEMRSRVNFDNKKGNRKYWTRGVGANGKTLTIDETQTYDPSSLSEKGPVTKESLDGKPNVSGMEDVLSDQDSVNDRISGMVDALAVDQVNEAMRAWRRVSGVSISSDLVAGGMLDRIILRDAPQEIRSRSAHGMAKDNTHGQLVNLLENGIDRNRGRGGASGNGGLDTAPLSGGESAGGGTGSGNAYSEGPFTLVASEGVSSIKDMSQVDYILVNSAVPDVVVAALRQKYPAFKFVRSWEIYRPTKNVDNYGSSDLSTERRVAWLRMKEADLTANVSINDLEVLTDSGFSKFQNEDALNQSERITLPDKITIDGVEKHTRNSNGDYIAADEHGIRNFYEWFGASKVVDADGRPLVVYHGTSAEFSEFDISKAGSVTDEGWAGKGFYFHEDPTTTALYGSRNMAVYLRLINPYDFTGQNFYQVVKDRGGPKAFSEWLRESGNDGSILWGQRMVIDPTQIKSVENVGSFSRETGNIYLQSAYHGSPYRFDKFSLDAIGTGEGAQAYGWGLYFAGQKEVAEFYRETLKGTVAYEGRRVSPYDYDPGTIGYANAVAIELLWSWQGDKDGAIEDADGYGEDSRRIKAEIKKLDYSKIGPATGQLYQVEIPEDTELLHWDKPLSEQPEKVRNALKNAEGKMIKESLQPFEDTKGTGIYRALIQDKGSPKEASEYLNSLGIKGIKYLDGSSRGKGEGSYNYVIFDDKVVTIEAVNDEMRQAEVFYQKSESGFFSQLQKAAEELKQDKGTPDQMLAMLKKAGAKDAEIEATGLKEFMELAGKSITKAQIVEFVSNNGVQVETTVLGAKVEEKEEGFSVIDDDGRRIASFETEEDADDYASENGGLVEPSSRQQARESRARNTNYTLPGGENHVELVLSIPNIEGWSQGDTTHYGDIADGKAVAWVRANDRTDADGKKVLFIEEIQSKRAQEGREKGFTDKKQQLALKSFDEWRKENPDSKPKEWRDLHPEFNGVSLIEEGYIPSAPFVEKTDAWVSLAMKRMITYAVENGYDRVAWTTGEQQADRYDLSKSIEKVSIFPPKWEGAEWTYNAWPNGGGLPINGGVKSPDDMEGIIGKEAAKKLSDAKPDANGTRSISGVELKVGGEGMKAFYDKIIPSVAKEVTKKMDGKVVNIRLQPPKRTVQSNRDDEILADLGIVVEGKFTGIQLGFDITDKMREQVQGPGLPLFQNKPDPLGVTYQMPLGDRVIKLFEKSNPSTMLHEMSHLFLLMEQDFAEKYGMTETHKDLLKWLGVESFDQITKDHHEQFAGSFEAYIMEGKSPSIALSDVFAAAKHWMLQVYEFIHKIPNQKIDPEISSIFDRLLATEQQLEEIKGSPMYNQFFADKDEAGWSNKDWIDYIGLQARRESKAKETVDQKLMKEWKRMRTKEWLEERNAIQETEEAVLKASPVYRAMASMREFKLNRDQALEAMGLEVPLSAEDRARKAAIPKPTDSLLVFAAKRGGLNIEAYKKEGIDPADMKKTQSGVFGKPVFTKDGMTPAQFNEAATEAGYMESRGYTIDAETYDDLVDDNDVLDLVTRSVIQGEEFFTVEGDAIRQEEAEKQRYLDQYFEEHGQYPPEEVVEETPEEKLAKSLKKYLSTDGMPVEMTATEHGYGSAKEMIEAVLAAPKIKEQAKINADEAMIAKYGTLLDDATLEAEVRDAVQNEEQAKLLLMEIKALGKVAKKKEINRDYLKMNAARLVDEMKRSDMRTGGVYWRMIKAAEAAKKANAEAAKIRAAIAKEKEAAAGELAAEVGERAVEAQNQLEEAEKDYKKKKEIMQDVYEDLKLAKGYAEKAKKERAEKDAELKAVEKSKKALDAKKKKGSEVDEAEYQALVERLKESKKAANEAAKAELSRNAAVVRLEKDYDVSRAEAQAARKLADTMKERAEKQVTRAAEKEGKVEEAKSETAKKLAELDAELVAVAEKALEFKIQHLANHYLYQEITERRAAMDRQLTYLRRVDGKDYDPKVVDPDYIAQAKKLIRLYNTVTKSKKDEQRLTEELSELLSWYDTQVKAEETLDKDERGTGNRQPLQWLSEELIAALAAKREGNLAEFKLKQISSMTAAEVQGLYDTIKHIRYIGGKTSEDAKAEYQKAQEEIADNIKENAGKTIKRKHEKNVFDRTKESLGAYWHSMESSFLMFSILDGFSNGPIMKHWEAFIDAVNRHIELERDFAKTIDGIMRPILVKIASPIKVTITKEDGVSWSLSKQARFVLLLNMGNQSNIDTVLQGMNKNYDDSYTHNDLMQMVSGMSKAELEAANKIWAYKDQTLWPLISAIQRKVSGVSAAKIEPAPFVVNGVKMIGGHYRLHYKADQKDQGRDFELESVGKMKMLMGKQASQIERVGSGGREVDLEHLHLYTDISQELRFIAFKEFSISISKFLNGANNPVRAAIIQHHGAEFLKYLEDTINGVVNRPVNSMDMFSRGSRAIRSNMVYSYLSFSLRSIVQAVTAVAPMMSQLGEARTLMAFMEFWSNPYGNFKKVDSMSMAMKERLRFINHEATTELSKLSAWSPVVNLLKKGAFMPHAVIDAFFAYPAWMGAKRKYLDENPVDSNTDFKRREKLANDFADLTMKQIMGSGHKADVGGVFSSPDEMVRTILFMGTFSNSMFNTNAYNIEKFKAGKMPWYELARRQGWMMIGAPLIWMAVLDEFPDPDDEEYWLKMAGQVVGYNFSMLVAANHVYNYAVNDFEFTLPLMKAVESAVGLSKSGKALVMGDEEFDLKMQAKIVRDLGPLIPMFGGSEMSRIMKGIEEERDWYSTYVTGKRD